MKMIITCALLAGLIAMKPLKKTRVVFFGDSITQMGINKGGYIDRMNTDLKQKNMQDNYELIGAGVGGNKVYDLYLRMQDDVLDKKPDVVVIWIGVNDVWHKTTGTGTDIEKYEQFYAAIIRILQNNKIKVVLATPGLIGEKKDGVNPQDKDLDAYSEVVRKIAKEKNCGIVDLRQIFLAYDKNHNTENKEAGILTTDKVHLTDTGNQLVADEMLKGLMQ